MKKATSITIKVNIPTNMRNVLTERAAKEGKDIEAFLTEKLTGLLLESVIQEYEDWKHSFRNNHRPKKRTN